MAFGACTAASINARIVSGVTGCDVYSRTDRRPNIAVSTSMALFLQVAERADMASPFTRLLC
jgi:hypothetical protein